MKHKMPKGYPTENWPRGVNATLEEEVDSIELDYSIFSDQRGRASVCLGEQREKIKELQEEVDAWRDCVMIDAMMSGPRFKGFDRSAGQRAFDKYILGKK